MRKNYIVNWTTAITIIIGMLGYAFSLLKLNDEFLAVLCIAVTLGLLVPQWFYAMGMPIDHIVISTAIIWTLSFAISIVYLLFIGEIYNIAIVNKIICFFTCPR